MKYSEIVTLTEDQLQDRLVDLKKEQFNLRFKKASGQLEATSEIRRVRRGIAKLKTHLNKLRKATSK